MRFWVAADARVRRKYAGVWPAVNLWVIGCRLQLGLSFRSRPLCLTQKLICPYPTRNIRIKPSSNKLCDCRTGRQSGKHLCVDVSVQSSITDYLVIATGTSRSSYQGIEDSTDRALKIRGRAYQEDRELGSGWIVDAFDFMIHLQTEGMRELCRLEQLWRDAERVELTRSRECARVGLRRFVAGFAVEGACDPPARLSPTVGGSA